MTERGLMSCNRMHGEEECAQEVALWFTVSDNTTVTHTRTYTHCSRLLFACVPWDDLALRLL